MRIFRILLCLFGLGFFAACSNSATSPSAESDAQNQPAQAADGSASQGDDLETAKISLEPPKEGEGFQFSMTATAEPFSEIWKCSVYPMPNDAAAAVNWVDFVNTPGLHHMTLSAPGFVRGDIPYGEYDCEEIYDQAMEDLIMFFGSQGKSEALFLPEGIVANFPVGMDVVHEVHYVNPTPDPVEVVSYVNAYTIPQDEVVEGIWGGQVRDETITIPAKSEHSEWTRCVMNQDVEVRFLASHTHKLGTRFTISRFDGETVGEPFYENDDWHDPKIIQYEPPIILKAGEGFQYTCTWYNPNDYPVEYGLTSDDEMCNLAIVHTPQNLLAQCKVVETSDGVLWE